MRRFSDGVFREFTAVLVLSGLVFTLVFFSTNEFFSSDPELTLLVSQSIVDNGTIHLDAYQDRFILRQPFAAYVEEDRILEFKGHYYEYFPTGPAIVAVPFVGLARLWGWDMARIQGNYTLQRWLSALSVVVMFGLLYKMGRVYVNHRTSLVMSLVTTLGSSLASTMGTALWSINFATIFMALVLLWLARGPDSWGRLAPFGVGFLLFLAFFCRASAVAFVGPALVYLLIKHKTVVWPTAVTAFICLLLFLFWSRLEFGQWLPAYYSAARLQVERVDWWIGVYGNLLSPSRGIFVFSPFLALGVMGVVVYWKKWWERPLPLLILAWLAALLLLVARGASWWGGWSFGSRLLTEIVPGLALLTFMAWQFVTEKMSEQAQGRAAQLYGVLGVMAIAVHSFQGLYNIHTGRWNDEIDPVPEVAALGLGDLFNWRYTQMLASPAWNCAINEDRVRAFMENSPVLLPYEWGHSISFNNEQEALVRQFAKRVAEPIAIEENPVVLNGYHTYLPIIHNSGLVAFLTGLEKSEYTSPFSGRRTECRQMSVLLKLDEAAGAAEEVYTLTLKVGALHEQRVVVEVNGYDVGEGQIGRFVDTPDTMMFKFPGTFWNLQGENEVVLELPEAHFTGLRGIGYEGVIFVEAVIDQSELGSTNPISPSLSAYP